MDLPQQMRPTALLESRVVRVRGVEVTAQHAVERRPQRRIDHVLGAAPVEEVARLRGAEGPDVAVVPRGAPAGLIGMDRRTGTDLITEDRHLVRGDLGHALTGGGNCAGNQMQLMGPSPDRPGWSAPAAGRLRAA